jgi:hypothetical protein
VTDSLNQLGGWSVSTEPNWSQWAYTLATVPDRLTRHAATREDREAAWRRSPISTGRSATGGTNQRVPPHTIGDRKSATTRPRGDAL